MKKMFKKFSTIVLFALFVLVMSVVAYADPVATIDVANLIGTGVTDIIAQLMAILALVVGGIMVFVGARLAINKGISLFRSLVNRA
jgi:hypothetical protein